MIAIYFVLIRDEESYLQSTFEASGTRYLHNQTMDLASHLTTNEYT
jgi:hypothetical protein